VSSSYDGPPMTLGNVAAARVRLVMWCKACGYQSEPNSAEQARWYGAETPVLEWRVAGLLAVRQPQHGHGGDRNQR
jgi:hypothetical protein